MSKELGIFLLAFLVALHSGRADPIAITGDIKTASNSDLFNLTLYMTESEEEKFLESEWSEIKQLQALYVDCQYRKIFLPHKTLDMCFLGNRTSPKFKISNIGDKWETVSFLTIENSKLINVPTNLFESFPYTTHLSFINAGIERIEKGFFRYGSGLQILSMTDNNIKELSNWIFEDLPLLSSLKLPSNQIEEIQENAFSDLTELTNLNLDKNRIKFLHPNLFASLNNLLYLSIVDNQIQRIPEKIFNHNPNLNGIILVNNQIEYVAADIIDYINEPHFLDLRNNSCTNTFINFHHTLSTRHLLDELLENC